MARTKFSLFAIAFLLTGCCNERYTKDCTQDELAALQKQTLEDATPHLVSEQDGVRLYRVWTHEPEADSHWTYFTTPCGDTSAHIQYTAGKVQHSFEETVPGTGCKR